MSASVPPPAVVFGKVLLAVAGVAVLVMASRRLVPHLLSRFVRGASREVYTAAMMVVVLGLVGLAEVAGVSAAMGAFAAGIVVAESEYLAGPEYSIADIAVWPWYGTLVKGQLYEAGEFLQVQEYRHVQRWTDQIAQRPAVKRGRMVNRMMGDPASQLRERHDASDFDTKTQDKLAPR